MSKEGMLESVKGFLSNFSFGDYEKRILKAISEVDRADFVEADFIGSVYVDAPLPTEKGQTISQPSTVARMLQLLELKKGDKVLEVGAGSGWNAALIGYLVGGSKVPAYLSSHRVVQPTYMRSKGIGKLVKSDKEIIIGKTRMSNKVAKSAEGVGAGWVLGLEVVDSLVRSAKRRIKKLGIENVVIGNNDFRKLEDKFDKIIFTAGIYSSKEEKLIEDYACGHLNKGGILLCPFQSGPLIIMKNKDGKIEKEYTLEQYLFVPLIL